VNMIEINDKYYKGYEGEHEIQFIKSYNNGSSKILSIWDGYFDDIMRSIEPSENGWTGLAYYYHLCIGWYNENPWRIPNLKDCLLQFNNLETRNFRFEKTKNVLEEICSIISDAINENESIWIAEE